MGTRSTRYQVTDRGGTSQIDKYLWQNLTKVMGSGTGEMIQSQQSQQQPTTTHSAQAGNRKLYRYYALAALMGYTQVYIETGIPRLWDKFQMSKECDDKQQELIAGMMYWAKKNGIYIYIAVFFVNLEIKETVKKIFNPGDPAALYESAEIGILPLMVISRTRQ